MNNAKAEKVLKRVEVVVPVKQRMALSQTKSSDNAVDSLAHRVATCAESTVISRGGDGERSRPAKKWPRPHVGSKTRGQRAPIGPKASRTSATNSGGVWKSPRSRRTRPSFRLSDHLIFAPTTQFGSSTVSTTTFSPEVAASSIPFDASPRSVAGSRLLTITINLPTSCSGS